MVTLQYTNKEVPLFFLNRFHKVHQMIDAFNDNYFKGYKPLWFLYINELMNSWLNKFCSGFMTLPHKPHPFGNKYHSIADGNSGKPIMWRIKLVEGRDHPKTGSYPSWSTM